MKAALKVLLWKMEATYSVDPVPTNTANVLVAQNVDINPVEMETDSYAPVSDKFGEDEKIVGAVWCSISFDVLLGGGGTPLGQAAQVPNHATVLRASSFAQVLSAGVSTVYSQVDTGEESAACYFYNDGVLFKMLGIRGSASFGFNAKKAPVLSFKGMGLRSPMTDAVMPVPTLPTIPRPVAMNKANTTLLFDTTYEARVSSFTIDQNNDVQYRNLTNREDVVIVGRGMSGKVTLELPKIAERDFLGATGFCTLATALPMSVVHGTVAGNIITAALPKVQLFKPKPKVEAGILMLECELHVVRNALTLTYT